ncbi:MAG: helix-turn-helix domain-containing protein [Steroidobacteraceae bacterium]
MTSEKTHRVGNRIRELRTRADLSQQQLAERVGATRQTINAIELEKYLPSMELAFKLAHVFEMPIDAIFRHPDASAPNVIDLKTFVPARDFDLSRSFYRQIGFHENFANREVAEFECGSFRFLLQNYFVQEFAASFMMQLLVTDTAAWWSKLMALELPQRYPGILLRAPTMQPWGLKILYLSDPSGVLWHIAEKPAEIHS